MCAMCIEQSLIDITTHRLTRSVTMRAAFVGGPLLSIAAIANNQPGKIGVLCMAPREGMGINNPEFREKVGEKNLRHFRRS